MKNTINKNKKSILIGLAVFVAIVAALPVSKSNIAEAPANTLTAAAINSTTSVNTSVAVLPITIQYTKSKGAGISEYLINITDTSGKVVTSFTVNTSTGMSSASGIKTIVDGERVYVSVTNQALLDQMGTSNFIASIKAKDSKGSLSASENVPFSTSARTVVGSSSEGPTALVNTSRTAQGPVVSFFADLGRTFSQIINNVARLFGKKTTLNSGAIY